MLKAIRRRARGAHVPSPKATANQQVVAMPVTAETEVVLLMQQHIGAPSKPAVKRGDEVKVGTLVGSANGAVSANIYSGVSGTVKRVEQRIDATGGLVDAVVIEADGEQTVEEGMEAPTVRNQADLIEAAKECGLVGLGGAGFPAAVKLSPPKPEQVDTLIINAAECEPYITSDNREILEHSTDIMNGIKAVQKHLNIKQVLIGIERDKPKAMDLLFSLTKGDSALTVKPLKARYPQGAEKVLIETLTGREVPSDGLPADIGVLVMNVTTVSTLGKYLATGMPLTHRTITVDGSAVGKPQNVTVPIGTSISDALAFCDAKDVAKVLMGGPMMGVAVASVDQAIIKQNNAILAFNAKDAVLPEPSPCIRCGRCVKACPHGLSPVALNEAYDKRNVELLEMLHAEVCMGCGVCSYVCPAKRHVSQTSVLAKDYLHKEGNS